MTNWKALEENLLIVHFMDQTILGEKMHFLNFSQKTSVLKEISFNFNPGGSTIPATSCKPVSRYPTMYAGQGQGVATQGRDRVWPCRAGIGCGQRPAQDLG
jgi:hypothetical protein